jgi:hypothetical protein
LFAQISMPALQHRGEEAPLIFFAQPRHKIMGNEHARDASG